MNEIKDKFKGINGVTSNKYSNMTWDEALSIIFASLPSRSNLKLETAKEIVVMQCRKSEYK